MSAAPTRLEITLEVARLRQQGLGEGGAGPWDRRQRAAAAQRNRDGYPIHDGWVNCTYSVQLLRHPGHPGIDHLVVRRHDDGTDIPWHHLQAIKDLAPNGAARWATEAFPPADALVDLRDVRC